MMMTYLDGKCRSSNQKLFFYFGWDDGMFLIPEVTFNQTLVAIVAKKANYNSRKVTSVCCVEIDIADNPASREIPLWTISKGVSEFFLQDASKLAREINSIWFSGWMENANPEWTKFIELIGKIR